MIRTLLFVAAAVMLGTISVSAQRLLRSEPANGAKDVQMDVGFVKFHFDRAMRTDSYTVWTSRQGKFPPTAGDNSMPWQSSQVFQLRIAKLEPNTTYALQLNSTKKTGFQTATGQALPITVITFKTASRLPPPDTTIGGGGDKPDTTIGGGGTDVPTNPLGGAAGIPKVGWRFDVKRLTLVDIVAKSPDGSAPMKALAKLAYIDEVKRVDQGRIAESTRTVSEASLQQRSPDAPDGQKQELCPAGSEFRVQFRGDRGAVTTAQGQPAPSDLADKLSVPLRPDIFPAGPFRVGQKWTYRDADVTRRLWFMQAQGGSLELEVIRIEDDRESGLRLAKIVGRLQTKLQLDNLLLDFDAQAQIAVPVAIGIPLGVNFKGKLSGEMQAPGTGGQTTNYTISGDGEYFQGAMPAKAIVGAPKPPVGGLPANPLANPVANPPTPNVPVPVPAAPDATWGYDKKNPIKLKGGSDATHAYLKTLCDKKGRGFRYRKAGRHDMSTDIYVLVDEDKKEHKLYVNHFGEKKPEEVPAPSGMQKGPGRSLRMTW